MDLIEAARQIMKQAHKGMVRRDGVTPYEVHPEQVYEYLTGIGATEAVRAAGLLHDVLEDGSPDGHWAERIEEEVGHEVLLIVAWLTNHSIKGPRKLRKAITHEFLRMAPLRVKLIKLVDRLNNLEGLRREDQPFANLYVRETADLLEVIGSASEELTAKIRQEMARIMAQHIYP